MKCCFLFDGAGLARIGFEKEGFDCTGVELDPKIHQLSLLNGQGKCVLDNAYTFNWSGFDFIWASPPCQNYSVLNQYRQDVGDLNKNLIENLLESGKPFIVENVKQFPYGKSYNANQFLELPIQNRWRKIYGNYKEPEVFREFNRGIKGIAPCVICDPQKHRPYKRDKGKNFNFDKSMTLWEYFGNRKPTCQEVATLQGFDIPNSWFDIAKPTLIYKVIGNGVPVYMAQAFAKALKNS